MTLSQQSNYFVCIKASNIEKMIYPIITNNNWCLNSNGASLLEKFVFFMLRIIKLLIPDLILLQIYEIVGFLYLKVNKLYLNRETSPANCKMEWGKDYSILITTDSVHYGNEGWNGRNCDRFGIDETAYKKAVQFEHQIIDECFTGKITPERIKGFYGYTVSSADYHIHKWTWCGRYSVPVGLLTAIKLAERLNVPVPRGVLLDYSTSLAHEPIPVNDLDGMGITAPANLRHWVGYAGLGYL